MWIGSPSILRLVGCNIGTGSRLSHKAILSARKSGITIGTDSMVGCRFSLDRPGARITVGNRCFIGASHFVAAQEIIVEDDAIVSWGVTVVDHDSHSSDWRLRAKDCTDWMQGKKDWTDVTIKPVRLGQHCWIGFNASILKGVTIGARSIVGAESVVTRDVAPDTIVAGNPARVVRELRVLDE